MKFYLFLLKIFPLVCVLDMRLLGLWAVAAARDAREIVSEIEMQLGELKRMLYRPSSEIFRKIVRAKMSVENGAVWVEPIETVDGLDVAPFALTCDADYIERV